ncbi:MAG: hypothetical protein Q4G03_11965, partial [Planctomycetia bacterium]|nr:hypothetical protein [Planctomycetia bacterium]
MKHRLSNLQPLSLSSLFERTSKKNTPATRGLKLESLENRELLSATTWESPAAVTPSETVAFVA